jgi:hypothetical protein
MKSVTFVPVEAPDCVVEVSAGPQASLSAPVELIVTLANKGASPITYVVTTEAFTIAVRNLDEGKECPPTERGRTSFAWPRTGTLLRYVEAKLAPGETRVWKSDLREYFQLSAADYEVEVGFQLRVPNVGTVNVVSPPIQIEVE